MIKFLLTAFLVTLNGYVMIMHKIELSHGIQRTNQRLSRIHHRIRRMQTHFNQTGRLSHRAYKKLEDWFIIIQPFDTTQRKQWQWLTDHIDMIPNSLLLAVALFEYDHPNRPPLAKTKNLFSQYCYVANCGFRIESPVSKKIPYLTVAIEKKSTFTHSLDHYVSALNSAPQYQTFRAVRTNQRRTHQPLDGLQLVTTLANSYHYNKQDVAAIKAIIKRYQLQQYD